MRVLLLAVMIALQAAPASASEAEWGPWEQAWAPVGSIEAVPQRKSHRAGLFEAMYRWYRRISSSRDGAVCPYYPTCSGFFILSVRAHGPLLGALYTFDRFTREYPFMERADHYPLVTPHETPRLLDFPPAERKRKRER
jgi:putative component of membrane protein insertase Oxa1/YidC/SpoIIIJ protein YidD